MTSAYNTKLRILGPIGLYLFVALFFRLDWYFVLPFRTILINDAIALAAGLFCWQLARWVILRIQRQYPGLANTRRRFLWLLVMLPVLINLAWLIRHSARFLIDGHFLYFNNAIELSRTLGIQLFYHLIYIVIYEGGYVLRQWQRATIEKDEIEQSNLQSQLFSLRHQVSPHFLFNSLNSLSSLISEDADEAETFVDELASVYRYLLRAGHGEPEESAGGSSVELVPLADELRFIDSYVYLFKVRYGQGIHLEASVAAEDTDCLIPPLTLQLLVENAVKHNVILPEQPLTIRIRTVEQQLIVENTLQRKTLRVDSNGVGLSNIALKYRLLNQVEPQIAEEAGWFRVTLPLLAAPPVAVRERA